MFFLLFIFILFLYLLYLSRDYTLRERVFFISKGLGTPISIFLVRKFAIWLNDMVNK